MFQRLKGAIDSRIAEEQAKTRALTESPNSSTSLARKTTAISTNQKRTRSKIKVEDDGIRGPDPSEFEEDKFVIDSDDTGENKDEKAVTVLAEEQNTEKVPISLESTHKMDIPEQNKIDETKAEVAAAELPVEVKAKLRKLDKLESRYQELLKSYRVAHSRAISIEPFEKTLRENTPLTTIKDSDALIEYLQQLNIVSEMTKDELKRVSADRDEHKRKAEVAEKAAASAKEELSILEDRSKNESISTPAINNTQEPSHSKDEDASSAFFSYEEESTKQKSEMLDKTQRIQQLETWLDELRIELGVAHQDVQPTVLQDKLNERRIGNSELLIQVTAIKKELTESKNTNITLTEKVATLTKEADTLSNALSITKKDHDELAIQLDNLKAEASSMEEELKATSSKYESSRSHVTLLEAQISELNAMKTESAANAVRATGAEEQVKHLRDIIEELKTGSTNYGLYKEQSEKQIKEMKVSIKDMTEEADRLKQKNQSLETLIERAQAHVMESKRITEQVSAPESSPLIGAAPPTSSKKKKNKKKKGTNASANGPVTNGSISNSDDKDAALGTAVPGTTHTNSVAVIDAPPSTQLLQLAHESLQAEILKLKEELKSRDEQIAKLASVREDNELLRDEIGEIGQEYVVAREQIKSLQAEKKYLQEMLEVLEKDKIDARDLMNAAQKTQASMQTDNLALEDKLASLTKQLEKYNDQDVEGIQATAVDNFRALQEALKQKKSIEAATQKTIEQLEEDVKHRQSIITLKDKVNEDLQRELEQTGPLKSALKDANEKAALLQKAIEEQNFIQEERDILKQQLEVMSAKSASQETTQATTAKIENDFKTMTIEYDGLKARSAALQVELRAVQELATSRYKEIADFRDILSKAQPELKSLRSENVALKSAREEVIAKTNELKRMESRERDLKNDIAQYKRQIADRETEAKSLNDKVIQETTSRIKAEDQARVAGRDLRRCEAEKIEQSAKAEKLAEDLKRVQEETTRLRGTVTLLDAQVIKLSAENETMREEMTLKNDQYATSQNLLGAMQDQTSEITMQLKEQKEQCESLEEQLNEVQRLLAERTREGEIMRRLLQDADDRAEAKIREMRERMDTAIEERDRAEEESSLTGRRRAREVDELKIKVKDAERDVKRALDEKEELERAKETWKKKREELEKIAGSATQERDDISSAMSDLRQSLDQTERQVREADKQKADLRRLLDDAKQKLEKLQKESKTKEKRLQDLSSVGSNNSSRASLENGRFSPVVATGSEDKAYIKTVLLQFLELKNKNSQVQFVPVLGKLLGFEKKDEEKCIKAINAH